MRCDKPAEPETGDRGTPQAQCGSCPTSRWLIGVVAVCVICFSAYNIWQRTSSPPYRLGAPDEHVALGHLASDPGLEQFDLTNLLIPRERILSGGPAKDVIPSLVQPETVSVRKVDFLQPTDRVVGVTIDGQSRAYPINVLNWHEAINDEMGGRPIVVIYCPLCDSVSVVDRRIGSNVYTFGISGWLYNSNVLLYDRTDQALWSQVGLQAISGPNAGKFLQHLSWELVPFQVWRDRHPDSTVVTLNTGHLRDYGRNPYLRYFDHDELMFPVEPVDLRMKPKIPVVGVQRGDVARAYPVHTVREAAGGRVVDEMRGAAIEIEADPSSNAVRVVRVPADARVVHTFWFAWAAFHPETQIYKEDRIPEKDG